jgi:hypothetical protein
LGENAFADVHCNIVFEVAGVAGETREGGSACRLGFDCGRKALASKNWFLVRYCDEKRRGNKYIPYASAAAWSVARVHAAEA